MFKRVIFHRSAVLFLAVLVIFVLLIGGAAAQDSQPLAPSHGDEANTAPLSTDNHTPGTATSLSCGSIVSGVIAANNEVDYYKIDNLTVDIPLMIKVITTQATRTLDPVLTLYDKNGTTQIATQDDFDNQDPRLHYTTTLNDPQGSGSENYITVHDYWGRAGATFTYEISWSTIQYVGMKGSGTVGGVAYTPSDILARTRCGSPDYPTWEMFFDGSDVGFDGNLRDFAVLNGSATGPRGAIIISTEATEAIPGFGKLVGQDLALFRPATIGNDTTGTFYRYFDASDVGLTQASERIDTVAVHPINGDLMLGTVGNATVPAWTAADEDIMLFHPSSLGTTTAGTWGFFFDGSDVGLGPLDVQSATLRRPYFSSPMGTLLVSLDKSASPTGWVTPPTKMAMCHNGVFGPATSCLWLLEPTFWELDDPGMTAIDGHDYGTFMWPGGGFAVAAERDWSGTK